MRHGMCIDKAIDVYCHVLPKDKKRARVTCPKCGRRSPPGSPPPPSRPLYPL
jgi:hypothetical protein